MIILNWFEHISLGFFLAFGLDYFLLEFTILETIFYYAFVAIGSLLPDIDTPKSKLGKMFIPISSILYNTVGHRTLTHSILIVTVIFFIFTIIWGINIILVGLMLGSIFHILGDMMTPSGVALLYPLKKRKFKIMH